MRSTEMSERNHNRLSNAKFGLGILALLAVPSGFLYMTQSNDADTALARQKAAIEADGFKVLEMPKSLSKDVFQDIAQANDVRTVLDLGRCTVAITAAMTLDGATQLPEVHDYAFTAEGKRTVIQNENEFQAAFGNDPCSTIEGVKIK